MSTIPDYHQHEEFQNRLRKSKELRALGINPYPHSYAPSHSASELNQCYSDASIGHSEEAALGQTPLVKVAGRLTLFRSMGKNAFAQLKEGTETIQVMFNRDLTAFDGYSPDFHQGDEATTPLKLIEKKIDLGDILGVEGHLFRTNKGELTIYVKKVELLCKTLLPLADKHAGLSDKETRYRKRWLDLISNDDVAKTFKLRSQIIKLVRDFLHSHEFTEVETPVLQSIYGGAEARPFVTKLNALDQEMFLRISLEIPLKKLIIGGMNRVFEIGRVFRNEGIDRTHNPEFTMMEAYATYWDYNDMMRLTENLFEHCALAIHGTTIVSAKNPSNDEIVEINLKAPWKRMNMKECLSTYAKIEVDDMTDEKMSQLLLASGHIDPKKLNGLSRGLLVAALFEVFAEPHLIQPHHVIDHPHETTVLCKEHRNPEKKAEGLIERFESFIMGQEVCNAYTELNDPELQRSLLTKQASRRDAGDEEASPFDEEFIEAMCQGMPPTGGLGIGMDRMVMILLNAYSIRDVLFFPWMKTH
ncbi:MAG: lysine--tRNA ligase [Parachlamydiaceae bacterium]|nr:lysine--tRNA ligase [Parachlamydiaceae bacterium]